MVYAERTRREGETPFKCLSSAWYYRLMRAMSHVDIPTNTGYFRLLGERAMHAVSGMREHHRFLRGMISWVGFRQTSVCYDRPVRQAGDTKYSFGKLTGLAKDGIYSFSVIPLQLATYLGFAVAVLCVLMVGWVFSQKYLFHTAIPGWASIMCAIFFLGAVQLICLGVLGDYLGRIYDEVRGRPLYLLDDTVGDIGAARSGVVAR